MRHVCASVATLIASTILLVGSLADRAPGGGLLTSAAHAQSKIQKMLDDLHGLTSRIGPQPAGIEATRAVLRFCRRRSLFLVPSTRIERRRTEA